MIVGQYLRISHDPLGARVGVERQRTDCEALAAARWPGAEVRTFEDNDTSAWSTRSRPAFAALCAAIRSRQVTAVVAYNLDRMFRHPRDLEAFLELCDETNMRSVATAQGDLDLTSHDGQLQARILVAVARKESDDKSRRVRRAKQDRAERGVWLGGPAPFGFVLVDGELVHHPVHASVVAQAVDAFIDGASITAIARRFGTTPGAPGSRQAWRKAISNPAIAGANRAGHRAQWEPIVAPAKLADVRARLDTSTPTDRRSTIERRWWLTGLASCGSCGFLLTRVKHRDIGRYQCDRRVPHRCTISVKQSTLEAFVEGAVLAAAPTFAVSAPTIEPAPDPDLEERLEHLAVDYASGSITRSEWQIARSTILEMADNARTAPSTPSAPATAITADAWATWTPTERHRAARWILRDVIVHPAPRGGRHVSIDQRVELVLRR